MEGKLNRVLSAAVVAVIAFALSLWGNGLGFLLFPCCAGRWSVSWPPGAPATKTSLPSSAGSSWP